MVKKGRTRKPLWQSSAPGQALMEYALILVLVAIALQEHSAEGREQVITEPRRKCNMPALPEIGDGAG